jgi:hypothetical protein
MAASATARISPPPQILSNEQEWKRRLGLWALEASQGHLNNVGVVTLTANATSTTVADTRAGANSFIGFMPTTANAATELATLYVATRTKEQFVITHANTSATDRTFTYSILG